MLDFVISIVSSVNEKKESRNSQDQDLLQTQRQIFFFFIQTALMEPQHHTADRRTAAAVSEHSTAKE